jgi:hypothetical protein
MKYNLHPLIKHSLSEIQKPKRFKLINPEILKIISNSQFYNSSFDDPFKCGLKLDDLNYRCTIELREKFIDSIISNDPRIIKVKGKRNFAVITCKNSTDNNVVRFVTFFDEKKSLLEGELNVSEKEAKNSKEKKDRLHNVQNKSRVKRKGIGKSRRK